MRLSNSTKSLLKVFLLFTFLTFVIFWPVFLGKVNLNANLLVSFYPPFSENLPFKNTGWDQLRIYFPFYRVTFEQYRSFGFPLWNPYAFSGHPHAADFQSAVFYPLNIFGLFLPQIEFWHLLRLSSTILASFFTFLYLRSLKLSKISSIFGAVTFGFSPFILTWGEEVVMSPHSILWTPLILFGVEKYLATKKEKFLAIVGISYAFSFLGGYMQTTIYLSIFAAFYLVFRVGLKKLLFDVFGLKLILAFVLGVLISAIQILPSAEIFFNAARAEIALKETLFESLVPIEGLLTYFAPDFFGSPATNNFFRVGIARYYEAIMFVGVGALMFAIFAVVSKFRDKMTLFLFLSALISLSTTLDLPTSKVFLSLPIPFLSTSIANRVLFVPAFCFAVLGAMGMDVWLKGKSKKIFGVIFAFGLIYTTLFAFLLIVKFLNLNYFEHAKFFSQNNVIISLRNLVIPVFIFLATSTLIVAGSLRREYKRFAAILIIFFAVLHIFRFSGKYFSFSERQYVFPSVPVLDYVLENQGYFRTWAIGDAYFETNFASQYGIYFPEGYDSLNNKSYGEFTYAMQGNRLSSFVFRADAGLGRGSSQEVLSKPERRRLIDILGVKYVIAENEDSETMSNNIFLRVFEDEKYSVWENPQVLPRVFLASNYEGPPQVSSLNKPVEEVEEERRKLIFDKLQSQDFDFRNVLILEKPSSISAQFGGGSAEIVSYRPQNVIVKTSSKEPKLLFLSDNYYPGWKARVDGDEVEILRADYTFRAVALTPGEHEVEFYFDSTSFKLGALISVFGFGVLAAFILLRK